MSGYAELPERTLENTPTWAVATVAAIFIVISLICVFGIEKIDEALKNAGRKPLVAALDKMKEELMLLGFISLLLSVFQYYVASICVKDSALNHWNPCDAQLVATPSPAPAGRRLLGLDSWPMNAWANEPLFHRRILKSNLKPTECKKEWWAVAHRWSVNMRVNTRSQPFPEQTLKAMLTYVDAQGNLSVVGYFTTRGYGPFMSTSSLHSLHIFIFVLACVHILYSLIAMVLASSKVKWWKAWEELAQRDTPANVGELTRSLTTKRQQSFIKQHTAQPWKRNIFFIWVVCFFRQFGQNVTHADYFSLRQGFITNHNCGHKFDFHKYLVRSLEDEYQRVVGISASLWFFVVIFLLFNVDGTNLYFYLSIVPVVVNHDNAKKSGSSFSSVDLIKMILLVGTKLQHVIATLALEHAGLTQGGHFAGAALKPRDDLFWFNKPQLILWMIHFIVFQNAFEMATFIWFVWQFGFDSCFLKNKAFVYARIGLGVVAQFMCSYLTLPLYAIVTQMGSHYKQAILQSHVRDKLHHWRKDAKHRVKHGVTSEDGSTHRGSTWSDDESSHHRGFEDDSLHGNLNQSRFAPPPTIPEQFNERSSDDVPLSAVELSKVETEIESRPSYGPSNIPRPKSPTRRAITIPKAPMPAYSPTNVPRTPKEELPKKYYKQVSTVQPEEESRPRPSPERKASFEFQP